MTAKSDFFKLDQEQWYQEFVERELSENFNCACLHREKFEFDDLPF